MPTRESLVIFLIGSRDISISRSSIGYFLDDVLENYYKFLSKGEINFMERARKYVRRIKDNERFLERYGHLLLAYHVKVFDKHFEHPKVQTNIQGLFDIKRQREIF